MFRKKEGCDNLDEIVFNCQVITPMFLNGADGQTPELRAPSIKGAMRFWWRAAQAESDLSNLRSGESSIFGDIGMSGKSKFSVIVVASNNVKTVKRKMLPHHTGDRNCLLCDSYEKGCKKGRSTLSIGEETSFKVVLRYCHFPEGYTEEQLRALFRLTCCLGGLGKRSRRGFGSISIISDDERKCDNLEYLLGLLNNVSERKFEIVGDAQKKSIHLKDNCYAEYPFIKEIQIGRVYSSVQSLLETIGKASHDAVKKGFNDNSLGSAFGVRFASPLYVSVLTSGAGFRPVITTLNMAVRNKVVEEETEKQAFFKGEIL